MTWIKKPAVHLTGKLYCSSKPLRIKDKFIPGGSITLSGDKSIAHRALILSAITSGKTILKNFPIHDDSLATLYALKSLGVKIRLNRDEVLIRGVGLRGLKNPRQPIFVNNSGTTLRLLLGVLAGLDFKTKVLAGKYLSRRPMSRVNLPLRLMGAQITARIKGTQEYAPILISGGRLKGITYYLKIASAQVKSAILLAGLYAQGRTKVLERLSTRDHTERMLKTFGADILIKNRQVTLNPGKKLVSPGRIYIPGDISSAAFFIVLALIIPRAKIIIRHCSLNPTRMGIIKVLKKMGADIKVKVSRNAGVSFEPCGVITASCSKLKGRQVAASQIPSLIDELPILMVAACFAKGTTIIKGVGELRVKETDRINSMLVNLKRMGADIQVKRVGGLENIIIKAQNGLCGGELESFGDHRTAMSVVIAALAAKGDSKIDDINCVNKSFPGFLDTLRILKAKN